MRFIARLNAPTYPDADQMAIRVPVTRANPAAGDELNCSSGPRSTSTADPGDTCCAISSNALIDAWPWPKTPRSETSAMSAGKTASTAKKVNAAATSVHWSELNSRAAFRKTYLHDVLLSSRGEVGLPEASGDGASARSRVPVGAGGRRASSAVRAARLCLLVMALLHQCGSGGTNIRSSPRVD